VISFKTLNKMKRTTKPKEDESKKGMIEWKKLGGGSLRINGKIIKPNQKFWARPEDISETFRDVIRPLKDIPEKEEEKITVAALEYSYKKRATSNYYDVFDAGGKKVNEKALTRQKALDLIKSYTEE